MHFPAINLWDPWESASFMEKRELLEKMPPFLTGGEMIDSVTREGAVFAELPHKFEAGTVNAASACGLEAAIRYVQSIGFDKIQERELLLTRRAFDGLTSIPHVTVLGSKIRKEPRYFVLYGRSGASS